MSIEAEGTKRAEEDFTETVRLDPAHAKVWHNRGVVRMRRRDLPAALADFEELLRQDPRSYDAYFGRGFVRRRSGDRAAAARDFEKALELAPPDRNQRATAEKLLDTLRHNR